MIMEKTLYKRNSNGSVQQWTIQVDGPKYRTIYGQVGGALITSEYSYCYPKNLGKKNETTGPQQALLDVNSIITKKLDREQYHEDINDIDHETFIEPMLAKKWSDYSAKVVYPVYSDPKLDGHRGVFSCRGFQTRKGEDIISVPHLVLPLYDLLTQHPKIVLDGEMYNHDLRHYLNRIASLVRQQTPTKEQLKESADIIQYWVFDGWGFNGIEKETPFEERKAALWDLLKGYHRSITVVKSRKLNSLEEVDSHYEDLVKNEFEGQFLRWGNCPYENKRTNTLLKRKDFMDDEFEVKGFEEGKGKAAGLAYSAVCYTKDKSDDFKAGMNFSQEELREIWLNQDKYIGKFGNVRFLKYSEFGKPLIGKLKYFRTDHE